MDEFETAIAAAQEASETNSSRFYDGYGADIARWELGRADRDFLRLITADRISGRALLSNYRVHRKAQDALIDSLVEQHQQHPDREWFWITLTWDTGVTWERAPEINTMSLRGIAGKHLRRAGFDGVGIVEIDVWKNFTGEPGRRVVAHIHFIGWSANGATVDIAALEADMRARRSLSNDLGARSVVIERVGNSPSDFATLGHYMLKRPSAAKNRVPRRNGEGYILRPAEHVRGSTVRLVEILSHLEVGDVLFSIGDGQEIADHVRAAARAEVRHRPGVKIAPSRDEVRWHWQRIRQTNGSNKFRKCVVITRKSQRAGSRL